MSDKYPDSFYRGIAMANYHEDGYLLPETFHSDGGRDDGYDEISITWNDEKDAFKIIASQLNDRTGCIQFSAGISKIERKEFERQMQPHIRVNNVGYERRPTHNNKYHGNILIKTDLTKGVKTMIKNQLVLLAQGCILHNPYVTIAAESK